jgi:hypothetical protein
MAYNPLETPIDFVIFRGVPTPGIGVVQKAKREIKVDEIGGYGVSGSVLVVHGRKLVPFDVIVTLLTQEHWEEWDNFKEVVLTMPSGPNATAIDVWHPWLTMLDVKSCVVNAVSQPEPDETGGFRITISCTEFRKPKPALAAPKSAENKPDSADTPAGKIIKNLTGRVQMESLGQDSGPLFGG